MVICIVLFFCIVCVCSPVYELLVLAACVTNGFVPNESGPKVMMPASCDDVVKRFKLLPSLFRLVEVFFGGFCVVLSA